QNKNRDFALASLPDVTLSLTSRDSDEQELRQGLLHLCHASTWALDTVELDEHPADAVESFFSHAN
ncbi:unnamed protein product, partial [Amoebophrya sp. A25]